VYSLVVQFSKIKPSLYLTLLHHRISAATFIIYHLFLNFARVFLNSFFEQILQKGTKVNLT
ncbi:hypothetical protein, partial [Paenibacillus polymyxa]|uniref:hypothetical protein n=1 Tax=Paenibacillus polymyxa TaxID=1406 RepID=UPI0005781862